MESELSFSLQSQLAKCSNVLHFGHEDCQSRWKRDGGKSEKGPVEGAKSGPFMAERVPPSLCESAFGEEEWSEEREGGSGWGEEG